MEVLAQHGGAKFSQTLIFAASCARMRRKSSITLVLAIAALAAGARQGTEASLFEGAGWAAPTLRSDTWPIE
jgi:hypothetical protein